MVQVELVELSQLLVLKAKQETPQVIVNQIKHLVLQDRSEILLVPVFQSKHLVLQVKLVMQQVSVK